MDRKRLSVIPWSSINLLVSSLTGALCSAECTARWCSARRRTPRETTSGSICPSWRNIPPSTSTPPGRRHFPYRRLPVASSVGRKINQRSVHFVKKRNPILFFYIFSVVNDVQVRRHFFNGPKNSQILQTPDPIRSQSFFSVFVKYGR